MFYLGGNTVAFCCCKRVTCCSQYWFSVVGTAVTNPTSPGIRLCSSVMRSKIEHQESVGGLCKMGTADGVNSGRLLKEGIPS